MLYTFRCKRCGVVTVVEHGLNEPHPKYCSNFIFVPVAVPSDTPPGALRTRREICAGTLERIFDPHNVTYHGSGFYTTDKALYEKDPDAE